MRYTILFTLLLVYISVFAQTNLDSISQSILHDGKTLYELENAAWTGTGILIGGYNTDIVDGHLSYKHNNDYHTIFFTYEKDSIKVLYTFDYGYPITTENAKLSTEKRNPSAHESILLKVRDTVINQIITDTAFYKFYPLFMFNMGIVERSFGFSVYAFSRTMMSGKIPLGNDYLLTFDPEGNFVDRDQLHLGLVLVSQSATIETESFYGTEHEHGQFESPFITPTDIATLLQYRERIDWYDHRVKSDKYISYFNIKTEQLEIKRR
jgi:hypothetical protein